MIPLALKGAFSSLSSRQHAPASRTGLSITRICPIIECLSHPEGLVSGAFTQVKQHGYILSWNTTLITSADSNDWRNIFIDNTSREIGCGAHRHTMANPQRQASPASLINIMIGMNGWSQRTSNPEQVTLQASPYAHRLVAWA